jgi:hypothetical protein
MKIAMIIQELENASLKEEAKMTTMAVRRVVSVTEVNSLNNSVRNMKQDFWLMSMRPWLLNIPKEVKPVLTIA